MMAWSLFDHQYPLGFMRTIIKAHLSKYHLMCLDYFVGATIASLSLWVGAYGLLVTTCHTGFMKSVGEPYCRSS
jgi:hypothetical protein